VSWSRPQWAVATWLCGSALLAPAAHAQMALLPSVSAGDAWNFAVYYTAPTAVPNRSWVVKSVNDVRIEATENGEPLALTRELNVLDSPRHSESDPRALSFPLQVGNRWRYTTDWLFKAKSSRGNLVVDVKVVSYEAVRVPAGVFEAFRLEAKGQLGGNSPTNTFFAGETTTTYWYAPAARAVVKSVYHNPYQGTTTVELVDFKLSQ
jgi:hypothetical protein